MPLFGLSEDEQKRKARADQAAADYQKQTGQPAQPEEASAEEGDISDYVLPFEGLGRNIVEKGIMAGVKAESENLGKQGASQIGKSLLGKLRSAGAPAARDAEETVATAPTEAPGLNYGQINKIKKIPEAPPTNYGPNGAMKPTYTDTGGATVVGNLGKEQLRRRVGS